MKGAKGAFHVNRGQDLVQIKVSGKPVMREDMVRLSGPGNPADFRYRASYEKWSVILNIEYNHDVISPQQIAHLFNNAGFSVGVGENRPGKSGDTWGMFKVA